VAYEQRTPTVAMLMVPGSAGNIRALIRYVIRIEQLRIAIVSTYLVLPLSAVACGPLTLPRDDDNGIEGIPNLMMAFTVNMFVGDNELHV